MRLAVPTDFYEWFDENLSRDRVEIRCCWPGAEFLVGTLDIESQALRYQPTHETFTEGAERPSRLFGKALARAGWMRPRLDPVVLPRLMALRAEGLRVEFILDTNAMVEGIGHWLVDLFADRCDLVVTAVSLRELQDMYSRSGFGVATIDKKKKGAKNGDILGARQTYLAACRFRESIGYRRVLWRELQLDDTALLLSRGMADKKSSESDTLLLRAVRRSVHDRVNGLERFFVTGDTALARRATTELPLHSVIGAQVEELVEGRVYFPCQWWPDGDQGRRLSRHPSRLVWELLAIADQVTLRGDGGKVWRFSAFENPMWPSDYRDPWIQVEECEPNSASSSPHGGGDDVVDPGGARTDERGAPEFWPQRPTDGPFLDKNLRLPMGALMDMLALVVQSQGSSFAIPSGLLRGAESKLHVGHFLRALDIAKLASDGRSGQPLLRAETLATAWHANDLDGLFDILRGWGPLEELATGQARRKRPKRTSASAKGLAQLLGQGSSVGGSWCPGGKRPSVSEIKSSVREAIPTRGPRAIPIHSLLVSVFLKDLGVSPVRAVGRWQQMWKAGVFDSFEPRTGGSSSGQRSQEYASLTRQGWGVDTIDLESVDGYRDLVYRSSADE